MTPPITPFSEIVPKYELFLVDIWGVVHDGVKAYPTAASTLNNLIATKKVVFLSNAPRPADVILSTLQKYGINAEVDHILTSGDVVRAKLKQDPDKKIYHLGADKNQDILRGIETVSDLKEAELVVLSAFLDQPEKDEKFDEILREAVQLNLPLICANPDTYVPHGDQVRRCSGVFAARYEKMGGNVEYYGKPHANIFEAVIQKCGLAKDKILMIGDTFDTDVLGARNFDIHVAMTLTGNGTKSYENLTSLEVKYGVSPTWVIEGL